MSTIQLLHKVPADDGFFQYEYIHLLGPVGWNLFNIWIISMLTDSDSQNRTYSKQEIGQPQNTNIFQQLLNQETIIRMSMVKNVHVLMKDMLTLKKSLLSAEGDISTLKQTSVELRKELHQIKQENERLQNENAECKENINVIRGAEKNTSDMLADMKIEVRYLSVTLLNLNEKVTDDKQNIPKRIAEKYSLMSAEVNKSLVDYRTDLAATAGCCIKSS
jgi:chromosome segregation ATPase